MQILSSKQPPRHHRCYLLRLPQLRLRRLSSCISSIAQLCFLWSEFMSSIRCGGADLDLDLAMMVQESAHADVEAVVGIAQVAIEISRAHVGHEELSKVLPNLWHLGQLSSNRSLEWKSRAAWL